jgi:hypothetical protein
MRVMSGCVSYKLLHGTQSLEQLINSYSAALLAFMEPECSWACSQKSAADPIPSHCNLVYTFARYFSKSGF